MHLDTDSDGNNLFHALGALGDFREAAKLLSSTPKKVVLSGLSAKNKYGMTPLHIAAIAGKIRVLNAYIEAANEELSNVKSADGYLYSDLLSRKFNFDGKPHKLYRFMRLNKMGLETEIFEGDSIEADSLALSNRSTLMLGIPNLTLESSVRTKDRFEFSKNIFSVMNGVTNRLSLGNHDECVVATSNNHSMVLAKDGKVFTWGKNINGILGYDAHEKVVTEPRRVYGSLTTYEEEAGPANFNRFSPLRDGLDGPVHLSSIGGVACSDFFSAYNSPTKVWIWGVNRGQMMNKEIPNAVVDEPILVYESPLKIKKITACDSALVILNERNQVILLRNNAAQPLTIGKSNQNEALDIESKGDYLVVKTSDNKLLRFKLSGTSNNLTGETMWTCNHKLDTPNTFDIGESGALVVATNRSVYRVEAKGSVSELRPFRGVKVVDIACNIHGYMAIAEIDLNIPSTKPQNINFSVEWRKINNEDGDFIVEVPNDNVAIPVHKAILYARCPCLRPFLKKNHGCTLNLEFSMPTVGNDNSKNTVVIKHASEKIVRAFIRALYLSTDKKSEEELDSISASLEGDAERFEYSKLLRIMTKSLSSGLWDSVQDKIACDVKLFNGLRVHSNVLLCASPVLAAYLSHWKVNENSLETFGISDETTISDLIYYIYTGEVNTDIGSPVEKAERLFSLWECGDVFEIPQLMTICENRLVEIMDYDMMVPFLKTALALCKSDNQRLVQMFISCVAKQVSFSLQMLGDRPNEYVRKVEDALNKFELPFDLEFKPSITELSEEYNKLKSESQLRAPTAKLSKSQGRKLSSKLDKADATILRTQINTQETLHHKVSSPSKSNDVVTSTPIKTQQTSKLTSPRTPQTIKLGNNKPTSITPSGNNPWGRGISSMTSPSLSHINDEDWVEVGSKQSKSAGKSERSNVSSITASSITSSPLTASSSVRAARVISPSSTPVSTAGKPIAQPYSSPTTSKMRPGATSASSLDKLPKLGSSLPKLGDTPPKQAPKQPPKQAPKATTSKSKSKSKGINMSLQDIAAEVARANASTSPQQVWKRPQVVETRSIRDVISNSKSTPTAKPSSIWGTR